MSDKHRNQNIAKIIGCVAAVLVVAMAIGAIAFFTNGFTSDFSTFYLKVNGSTVMQQKGDVVLPIDKPTKVDVVYAFGGVSDEASGYTVKVVPNVVEGQDFDIVIDGIPYSFQEEEDFTKGFDIQCSEDSFTILPKGNLNEVMAAVYEGAKVEDCVNLGYPDMFTLVVTSYNGEDEVRINFCLHQMAQDIELSVEEIVF